MESFFASRILWLNRNSFRLRLQEHHKQPKVLTWPQMPIQSRIHGLRENCGQNGNFIIALHLVPEHPAPVTWRLLGSVSSVLHDNVVAHRLTLKETLNLQTLQTPHHEIRKNSGRRDKISGEGTLKSDGCWALSMYICFYLNIIKGGSVQEASPRPG